jgi:hypothetical protein
VDGLLAVDFIWWVMELFRKLKLFRKQKLSDREMIVQELKRLLQNYPQSLYGEGRELRAAAKKYENDVKVRKLVKALEKKEKECWEPLVKLLFSSEMEKFLVTLKRRNEKAKSLTDILGVNWDYLPAVKVYKKVEQIKSLFKTVAKEIYTEENFKEVDALALQMKQTAALDEVSNKHTFNREGFEKQYRKRWLNKKKIMKEKETGEQ